MFVLVGLVLVSSSCDRKVPTPPPVPVVANATDPQWVSQADPHAKVAMVFVHGLFGDTLGTWRNDNGETFFRLLKSQPDVGGKVDVFAFGFTSNMLQSGSFDIQEAANKLHDSLQFKGVLDYPTIVFAAHSMGGLVVLRELLTHRELLDRVPLVVLYATPQEGAQIAAIADHVANNPALVQMLPADRNGYLQQLNDEWKSLPTRPHVTCAYEKLPTHGMLIVPWSSATRFCDGTASAVDADHLGIVKPDRLEHPSLVTMTNALNTFVVGKQLTAKLDTPDFAPEGDHFVFHMGDPFGTSIARLVNAGGSNLTFTLAGISDPHLYLSPDDTPRQIPANKMQQLRFLLTLGASAAEYRFVLQSDVAADRVVVVRVDNFAEVTRKQADLLRSISNDINSRLADPATLQRLRALPAAESKAAAEAEVLGVVRDSVARNSPDLPRSAQWLLAASALNATNWPDLAGSALREAEKISPATARSSSASWLAGTVAAESGKARVFSTVDTPSVAPDKIPSGNGIEKLVQQGQGNTLSELASRLQQIPGLKAHGLSLQGDILTAKGDREAASTAYRSAAALGTSPSLSRRMGALQSPQLAPNAAPELSRERTTRTDSVLRTEVLRERATTDAARVEKR